MTIDEALAMYRKNFGENYPLCIVTMQSEQEIIDEIIDCIKTNKKAKEPEYKPGILY